ncbi:MAG TPA: amidase [Thermomicrobiales bacterium]|nr:amidase [Chloroflexota bacterium]HBY47345.1 amidase [Chloroflexota bacterium]HCG30186.1 amidase [Chloroflexota bacterium]HQZ89677.1 amidase [Thermomicrobiales bacterium]HRA32442.1 amidase [Thermomicrobiales bacterium]
MAREIYNSTIAELGALLRSRETTPTELTRLYLERLDTVARRYNAVVTITEERALREAVAAEAEMRAGYDRGPLHGIPWGAKDLLAVEGYPTTWGAPPYRDQTFGSDATVVRRLRDAGAVLVAKLGMVELAGGMGYKQPNASLTGPGITPWQADTSPSWSGGSSSGSGSAVAAGAVGFAIGSETWGSIVTPAAFCGITGLRPTYGRVSRHGAMALSWTLDKLGPMCRSAEDCGLVLAAIAGDDPADGTASRREYAWPPAGVRAKGFRFGVLSDATVGVQPEVRANFEASLSVLEEIGTVEVVSLPEFPYNDVASVIIQGELAAAFEDLMTSGDVRELTAPEDRINGLAALALPAHVYIRALRIRRLICRALDELMAGYDALIAPTLPTVASPIGEAFDRYFDRSNRSAIGAAANIAGLPGVAVPNGFGERGLPTSLSFVGRAWGENDVLAAAHVYQQRTHWHQRHPL